MGLLFPIGGPLHLDGRLLEMMSHAVACSTVIRVRAHAVNTGRHGCRKDTEKQVRKRWLRLKASMGERVGRR